MVLTLVRLRGDRVHAEQDTLVIAPYAGLGDGHRPFRQDPQLTRMIPGLWAKRLPALRRVIRRNRAAGDEESDCRPITTTSSR